MSFSTVLIKAMSKRRTWASLFFIAYFLLLSSSWNLLLSIRSWYASSNASASCALYASLLYGAVFGLLAMGAALAVAVPATVVTWITIVVLMVFAGKPRRRVVSEGRRITGEIVGFGVRVMVREGNVVAGLCAVLSFGAMVVRSRGWL